MRWIVACKWIIRLSFIVLLYQGIDSCQSYAQSAFWLPSTGPEGGDVTGVFSSPSGILYANSWSGMIFQSSNRGLKWEITDSWKYGVSNDNVITSNGKGMLFVDGWPPMEYDESGSKSWEPLRIPGMPFAWSGGDFFFDNDGNLVASMAIPDDATWKRMKDGSWRRLNDMSYSDHVRHPDGSVWAIIKNDIYKTTDGGGVWDSVRKGYAVSRINILSSGCIFVTETDSIGRYYDVLELSNDARHWITVDTITRGFRGTCIVELNDGELLRNDFASVKASSDTGMHWTARNTNLRADEYIHRMTNIDGTLFATTMKGIYASSDRGYTWQKRNRGLSAVNVASIASDKRAVYAAAWENGLFRSTDRGMSWSGIDTLSDFSVRFVGASPKGTLFVNPSNPYKIIGDWKNALYRSSDGGITWVRSDNGIVGLVNGMIYPDSSRIYAFGEAMYLSTDEGETWTRKMNGTGYSYFEVGDMAVDRWGRVYAVSELCGIFRSTDGMENWTSVQGTIPSDQITAVAVGPNGDVYCAPHREGIYKSTDYGNTWSKLPAYFDREWVESLQTDPAGNIYAGVHDMNGGGGVWYSSDGGNRWSRLAAGITSKEITRLHIARDGYLYAGTYGSGVFRSASSITSVQPTAERETPAPLLHEIYPTILSSGSTAHIGFTIEKGGRIEIRIFDGLGRLRAGLGDNYYNAGSYTVPLAVSNYRSGVYYYQILFGGKTYMKSFMVLN